jgi:hypothetical protein
MAKTQRGRVVWLRQWLIVESTLTEGVLIGMQSLSFGKMAAGIARYFRYVVIEPTAQSNNSLNRSANSIDFIRETCTISVVRRARLIRALDTLRGDKTAEARVAEFQTAHAELNDTFEGRSNNSLNASGMSLDVVENLSLPQLLPAALIRALGCFG